MLFLLMLDQFVVNAYSLACHARSTGSIEPLKYVSLTIVKNPFIEVISLRNIIHKSNVDE
jgi:hypothetical protein